MSIKARMVPDNTYPGLYRVRWPDGSLSDLGNISRVNDAAARFNGTFDRNQRGRQKAQEAAGVVLPSSGYPHSPQVQITSPSSMAA